jgi:hypothetical protein
MLFLRMPCNEVVLVGILGQIEGMFGFLPNPFKKWVSAFCRPAEVAEAERAGATLVGTTINGAILGAFIGVLMAIMIFLIGVMGGEIVTAIISAVIAIIAYTVVAPIGIHISSIIYFIVSKILGGKGSYSAQTQGLVMVAGGEILLMVPFMVLAMLTLFIVPCIALIFYIPMLAIGLYGIYAQYRVIKQIHSLSTMMAVIVILTPVIIAIILGIIVAAIIGAALASVLGSVSSMGGY